MAEHTSSNQRSPVRFRAQSHTRVRDNDETCSMHLTPGVVHNFPKAVGVWGFCPLIMQKKQQIVR